MCSNAPNEYCQRTVQLYCTYSHPFNIPILWMTSYLIIVVLGEQTQNAFIESLWVSDTQT